MTTTPAQLAQISRERDPASIVMAYVVHIWRRDARSGRSLPRGRSFDNLEDAMRFFNSRHVGANHAELSAFDGSGYPVLQSRWSK